MTSNIEKIGIGCSINNWVVIEEMGLKGRTKSYKVQCKCGKESIKKATQIRKNKMCYECSRKLQTENGGTRRTHGACSENSKNYKTYMAWHYMKSRCNGKTEKEVRNYVNRGIKICDHWINSFETFLSDMGERPEGCSLDRIDNDKGYFKENCRWADIKTQNDNKRGCVYFEFNGEKLTVSRWAEKLGITRSKAAEWIKRDGIESLIKNIDLIKKCKPYMSNKEYKSLGMGDRKGSGQRVHAASRNRDHPLHKMYKSWDYMKRTPDLICAEWMDFLKFVDDMGQKPDGKRLLRKIKHQIFCKENCYWG
jgi:hypothetical protein